MFALPILSSIPHGDFYDCRGIHSRLSWSGRELVEDKFDIRSEGITTRTGRMILCFRGSSANVTSWEIEERELLYESDNLKAKKGRELEEVMEMDTSVDITNGLESCNSLLQHHLSGILHLFEVVEIHCIGSRVQLMLLLETTNSLS
jgi:hypothetical protein